MSAQIITALRKRADALDAEGRRSEDPRLAFTSGKGRDPGPLRMLAAEFRALADEAEAR